MDRKTRSHLIATIIAMITMGVAGGSALAGGLLAVEFNPVNFSNPRVLDNDYWPLLPGGVPTTFIYLGETEDGCVFDKITADPANMKPFADSEAGYEFYDGIIAQVVVDREWELEDVDCEYVLDMLDGDPGWEPDAEDLGEWTDDWYIQDNDYNIWYMGEASRDFGAVDIDEVEVECPSIDDVPLGAPVDDWGSEELFLECTGGSWEAGQLGQEDGEIVGEAGIVVPGDFPLGLGGDPLSAGNYWMQEVAEGAEDMAKVLRLNAPVAVDDGQFAEIDFENCRKIKEWNPVEHGESVEHKYYCAGPGLLLIEGIGGGPTESEVLVISSP